MLHYCNLHLLPTRRPLHFPGVTLPSKRELPNRADRMVWFSTGAYPTNCESQNSSARESV